MTPLTAEGYLTVDENRVIWALSPAITVMMRNFEADLQREHRMSHTEYIALMFLSEAPERTLGSASWRRAASNR